MAERVLVTGTGGTGVGAGVLQSLAGLPAWELVAADANPFSWGLYTTPHRALLPWADDVGYLAGVAEVAARFRVSAIIPGTEAETAILARWWGEVPAAVIVNEPGLMPLMRDKNRAQEKLAELGLPSIPSYPWEDARDAAMDFGFPLVVKPTLDTSGSRGVHLVHGLKELDALNDLVRLETRPVVQPYLGDAGSEYTVGVVSGRHGDVIGSIVIRRELTGLSLLAGRDGAAVSTGFTQGWVVDAPEVSEFCEDLAKRLGSRGPLNLQLRVHRGEFHVFEIHPRFSFSAPIRASAGFNEADMLLRNFLHGETVPRPQIRTGAAIRAFQHVLVPEGEMLA